MKHDSTPDALSPSRQPAEPTEEEPIFLDNRLALLIDEPRATDTLPPQEHASLVPMAMDVDSAELCESLPVPPQRRYPLASSALAVSVVAGIVLVLAAPLLVSSPPASSTASSPTTIIVLDEMVIEVEPPEAPKVNPQLVLSEVEVIGDVGGQR